MTDFTYSKGADGTCQVCGEDTDEPWHAFCPACFAQEEGWDDEAVRPTVADSRYARIMERLDDAEMRLARVEAVLRAREGGFPRIERAA